MDAHIEIQIVLIMAVGLIISALIITLIQCLKKAFLDDTFYRQYRHFWLRLAGIWYVGGAAYLAFYTKSLDTGILTSQFTLTLAFLFYLVPFFLILLAVSLIPATWQHCGGKNEAKET